MNDAKLQLIWVGLIVLGFMLPLIAGAIWVEVLAPKSREWIRRLHSIERGKRHQAANHSRPARDDVH
jgi:hypothetical protein